MSAGPSVSALDRSALDLGAIAALLRSHPLVAQWQITETVQVRHERYLTFLATESEREASATNWQVWIARAANTGRQGEATFSCGAGDGVADCQSLLHAAVDAAASAPNPAFTLPRPGDPGVAITPRDPGALADRAIADHPTQAMQGLCADYAAAAASCPWVRPSTLEVFLTRVDRRLLNHAGLELMDRRTRAYVEFVLLHRPPGRPEVEFYDKLEASRAGDLRIAERVSHAAACVRDGALAVPTPAGQYPVIIADDYLADLLSYYRHHADAGVHARKINAFALDAPVLTRSAGDPLTMHSDPTIPSLAGYQFDELGYAPCSQSLLREDRLEGVCGHARWMHHLGREPHGMAGTLVVRPGTADLDQLRQGALEVVRLSDLHPRLDTGAFSGEIRLAYLHLPGGERRAVCGGSVTGLLSDAFAAARFSRQTVTCGGYHGPRAVRMESLTIAG